MKELYRSYFYPNGHELRLEGITSIVGDKTGMTLIVLTTGETVVVVPGWIATKFLTAPLPPQAVVQRDPYVDPER